jgi:hypothetical protein
VRSGQRLEPQPGFAFVAGHVEHARDRGDRVEQPAHAAGAGGIQAGLEHGQRRPQCGRGDPLFERGEHTIGAGCAGMGKRAAPRLTRGELAARQRHGGEVRSALEARVAADQDLAAPQRSIGPEPAAVEAHADQLPVERVVHHAARHVRMVVLHQHQLDIRFSCGAVMRVAARGVVGMQIAGDALGPHAVDALEGRDRVAPGDQRVVAVEIAEVRA